VVVGPVIANPVSGERIVITYSDSELLAFELYLPPGGHVPAGHVHPRQEERFTVIEGELRFKMHGQDVVATRGMTVSIPPGTAHWFGNQTLHAAHAHVEVRPPLRMHELLATTPTVGRSPLKLALMLLDFQTELAVPFVPASLMRLVLWPLAWLGRCTAASSH
jgi:quercetin dioxygenase-like cupin family protein